MAEEQKQEITSENKVIRNEKGQIIQGTANPHGRPKGAGISITTEIKRKLEEVPDGHTSTYLKLLIDRILKQSIVEGDTKMIDRIWAYIDGMPRQSMTLSGDEENPIQVHTDVKSMIDTIYGKSDSEPSKQS